MKTLKLKNYFFVGSPELQSISLQEWIAKQMLHGQESRARTRFLQSIAPRVKEVDDVRLELLKKHAEKQKVKQGDKEVEMPVMTYVEIEEVKGENGEMVKMPKEKETTDASKGKRFKVTDADAFNADYQEYLNEDYIVDVIPSNRDIVYRIKDILTNTNETFAGRMALLYDEWCNAFEDIKEDSEGSAKVDKKAKK